MKEGISGYVPCRNIIRLDYCAELAVKSLLPVCDEVVVCDSDSDDGTREFFEQWMNSEPKLRVINYPWPNPCGDPWMLKKWLNFARDNLECRNQLTLDADEVLHPGAYPEIQAAAAAGECRWFKRFNFWMDCSHLVPEGHVCGTNVARLGPTDLEMVSDNPHPEGEPEIRKRATYHDTLRIWHLGFLRKPAAFFAKSKVMQHVVCNSYDPRLAEAERTGQPWYELSTFAPPLDAYTGKHPEIVHEWLKERGYSPR